MPALFRQIWRKRHNCGLLETSQVSAMQKITVNLGKNSYPIYIDRGNLRQLGDILAEVGLPEKVAVITHPSIARLYGEIVCGSLSSAGFDAEMIDSVPEGEESKSFDWAYRLYEPLIEGQMDRSSAIIALGGGVIGDLAGFVAATYMRGVPFVQVPTTSLAQVDSSVGGKVAVNHPKGKNLIGAFHQPKAVLIDVATLNTLPEREFLSGLVEVIKHGVIMDKPLFEMIEENIEDILDLELDLLVEVIAQSCRDKASVVEKDEKESGLRATLNYGHTFAHAIETLTDYNTYRHGEAVAIGMICASQLSVDKGLMAQEHLSRQIDLLKEAGLPTIFPDIDPETALQAMYRDKKAKGGKIRYILPTEIGRVIITDEVENDEALKAIKKCQSIK